jgi:hypothetical protein
VSVEKHWQKKEDHPKAAPAGSVGRTARSLRLGAREVTENALGDVESESVQWTVMAT